MRALVLAILVVTLASSAAQAQDRAAIERQADAAVAGERWCDALYFYLQLDRLERDPKNLFNAAELARAAGDLVQARVHYRDLVAKYPKFAEVPAAQQALRELDAEIARKGPGRACNEPAPACGNGVVERGELCDDGNTNDGDVCVERCTRVPVCGDAVVDAGETCDDGNRAGADGCNNVCQRERCGNGVLDMGEDCDDGNAASGDGCAPDCKAERISLPPPPPPPPPEPDERADERDDDDDERERGLPAALSWSVVAGGGIALAVGGAVALLGGAQYAGYASTRSAREAAQQQAEQAQSSEEYIAALDGAADRDDDLRAQADAWNGFGRFAFPGGALVAIAGVAGIGAGVVMLMNAAAPPSEGDE